jgi:hypothetical protein
VSMFYLTINAIANVKMDTIKLRIAIILINALYVIQIVYFAKDQANNVLLVIMECFYKDQFVKIVPHHVRAVLIRQIIVFHASEDNISIKTVVLILVQMDIFKLLLII